MLAASSPFLNTVIQETATDIFEEPLIIVLTGWDPMEVEELVYWLYNGKGVIPELFTQLELGKFQQKTQKSSLLEVFVNSPALKI